MADLMPDYIELVTDAQARLRTRIERDFTYHRPASDQQESFQRLRDKAKELAHLIVDLTPPSREQSVALTELETSVMWANASIARPTAA